LVVRDKSLQRITIDPQQLQANQIALTAAQLHYLQRVMRLQTGAKFQAIDGSGTLYLVELSSDSGQILEKSVPTGIELPVGVSLIVAVPKIGLDDVVRACTELGVSEIYPVTSDRTIVQPSEQKRRRWLEIAKEATEQSERLIVPTIHPVQSWKTVMVQITGQRKICAARGDAPHLMSNLDLQASVSIAIGPEGGWTDRELQQSIDLGWQPVSLGDRILRTITAPLAAMSMIGGLLERAP
jgi:16S rRNA (uracil1498-N3)-methyltransferase